MSSRGMVFGLFVAAVAVAFTLAYGPSLSDAFLGGFGMGIFVTAWAIETSTRPRQGAAIAETSDTDPRPEKINDGDSGGADE